MAEKLLVEDNEMTRGMLSRALIKRWHDVVIAVGSQARSDAARNGPSDLILLDMSLPVVDGWTAAGHLKSNTVTNDVPILTLTAHALAGDHSNRAATSTTRSPSTSNVCSARSSCCFPVPERWGRDDR